MSFPFYDDPAGHYPPDTYHGDTGEASAWIRPSATTPEIEYTSGGSCEYLLTGPRSAGKLGIYRWSFGEKESGPDAHFHKSLSESFFVLSGTIRLFDGSTWLDGRPGDYLYVPEGGLHGFRNESGEPASMLILFAPGAPREAYFEGLAKIGRNGMRPSPEEMAEFYLRHDTYWV